MTAVPVLETDRLVLRGWRESDFEPLARFYADADMTRHTGGPKSRIESWQALCAMAGQWSLRGFGVFAVEEKRTDALAGYAGLWYPQDIPEPELCWSLFAGHQGRGYATEAAQTARDWANGALGLPALMSFIHPDNLASRRVAERLGAAEEGEAQLRGAPRLVYRHITRNSVNALQPKEDTIWH
jgi:RimJ/RimL family protein N-acetyltransferase